MKVSLSLFFSVLHIYLFSQKEYSLQECLDLATKNDQMYIASNSNFQRAEVNQQFIKWSFLPNLYLNTGYNISYGRKLDPFTNTFGSNSVHSNFYGLTTQFILFQGFRYANQNKLYAKNTVSFKLTNERNIENTKNQLIERCVSIWKTQLKLAQQTKIVADLELFQQRQIELVKEGKLSALDTLTTSINRKTQLVSLWDLQRELDYQTINLNYLLGLPLMNDTRLQAFDPLSSYYLVTLDEYYQLEDLKNRLDMTQLQYKIDKTDFLPYLSLTGNIGTGYSTNNKNYNQPDIPIIPYSQQINQNLYQGANFTLNVPVFSRGEWYRQQKIFEINKNEQQELIEFKEVEIEKKKGEIQIQIRYLETALTMQKEILKDKESVFQITQVLYLEGRIRLNELEIVEAEYYNYLQTIQDLEIELMKIRMIKLE